MPSPLGPLQCRLGGQRKPKLLVSKFVPSASSLFHSLELGLPAEHFVEHGGVNSGKRGKPSDGPAWCGARLPPAGGEA